MVSFQDTEDVVNLVCVGVDDVRSHGFNEAYGFVKFLSAHERSQRDDARSRRLKGLFHDPSAAVEFIRAEVET
jgi:hypothetical protein